MNVPEGKQREERNRLFGFELLKDLDILEDFWLRGEADAFVICITEVKKKVKANLCPRWDWAA